MVGNSAREAAQHDIDNIRKGGSGVGVGVGEGGD